jgi:hypothetical protein
LTISKRADALQDERRSLFDRQLRDFDSLIAKLAIGFGHGLVRGDGFRVILLSFRIVPKDFRPRRHDKRRDLERV